MNKKRRKELEKRILQELESVKADVTKCPKKTTELILLEIMKDIKLIKLNTTKARRMN